jgi:hypothetical protein
MPFLSEAQRRYMFANHPEIAKRWAREYGTPKDLPFHVKRKRHGRGLAAAVRRNLST